MAGYTKLHSSIVNSTIWDEDKDTRILWITMLAISDAEGAIEASVPGLAHQARLTVSECQKALAKLMEPDEYSKSKEYNGCRVIEKEGGWLVVNYGKYRNQQDLEERRRQNREAQQRWRDKQSVSERKQRNAYVSSDKHESAHAEAEAEAKAKDTYIVNFEKARLLYPGKKRGKEVEFANFCKHHKDWRELLDDDGLAQCVQAMVARQSYSKEFWPMFQTFCNQSRYEEAMT